MAQVTEIYSCLTSETMLHLHHQTKDQEKYTVQRQANDVALKGQEIIITPVITEGNHQLFYFDF